MNLIEKFNEENHTTNIAQRFEEFINFAQQHYDILESPINPTPKSCDGCVHDVNPTCYHCVGFNHYQPAEPKHDSCNGCKSMTEPSWLNMCNDCKDYHLYEPKPAHPEPKTAEEVLAEATGIDSILIIRYKFRQWGMTPMRVIEAMKQYHEQFKGR
jgi:hypothetical protein